MTGLSTFGVHQCPTILKCHIRSLRHLGVRERSEPDAAAFDWIEVIAREVTDYFRQVNNLIAAARAKPLCPKFDFIVNGELN